MSSDATGLTFLDRPNSYIGRSVPRPNARRLLEGRGVYVDDVAASRLGHVAFLRSPHAHARLLSVETGEAKAMPGVIAVVTGPSSPRSARLGSGCSAISRACARRPSMRSRSTA